MARGTERWESRRDTWLFAGCMLLSVLALLMPAAWGMAVAAGLRTTALAPFVWLQERAAEGRTSRTRFRAVASERDSLAELSRTLSGLAVENSQLRSLLSLTVRTGSGFIPAEVLHQTLPTDGRTLLLDAGRDDGVAPLDPVVTPEGLIGAIREVDAHTSIAMTWAHPEFRVSAVSANGQVAGIVGPTSTGDASRTGLEFRAITYRDTLADGAVVIASGLGGVYPRGIPVGTVVGVEREQLGWERVYRLRPSAQPSVAGHVLILHGATPLRIPAAFAPVRDTTDSVPTAQPLTAAVPPPAVIDSAARARARASRLRRQADSAAASAASGVVPPAVEPGPVQGPPPVSTPRADTGVAQ
jgi:rod shape-determining protein MreC